MNPIILKRSVHHIPVLEVVLKELREERIPVVIYYHGWQTSKELVLTQGRKIAQQGIRVILPDAMNHGERKQPVSSIPSYTFWDSIYGNLFEFDTLIKHLEKRGLLHDQLAVGGVSMGGMTTCALLAKHPHIVAGVCLMGSPAPLEYGKEIVRRGSEYNYVVPKDYFDLISWVKSYDLSLQQEKLAGRPLFFWHGQADEKIPYIQTERFVEKNRHKSYGKEIVFRSSKTQRHMVQIPLMEEASTFLAKNLIKKYK
ncbi:alpha/beta fold hydrolase [Enterococcus faecium]|uniref:alpha/beta fold hydrolase n=1 Tax=Enterococcus faecium TaxID=1352 RepID=UPI0018838AFB|nr:alpha/beta fold hydrolase [Enterococcus faecium]MBE9889786.1 alpha/beta fold hydrolase [Enterococcus faecium]MEB7476383.1 alpha/beta fold hydrolase [Enterococcus faecium]MEB8314094.1 alpha/beta fold hydrolase [Enterococcus faecium]MEB8449325.1 alpha/beta fold hydrolase [Enterococcus faecium]